MFLEKKSVPLRHTRVHEEQSLHREKRNYAATDKSNPSKGSPGSCAEPTSRVQNSVLKPTYW